MSQMQSVLKIATLGTLSMVVLLMLAPVIFFVVGIPVTIILTGEPQLSGDFVEFLYVVYRAAAGLVVGGFTVALFSALLRDGEVSMGACSVCS